MYTSSIPEYILGIDVMKGLTIEMTEGEFCLWVPVIKRITRGHLHHVALRLPDPHQVDLVLQYNHLGGELDNIATGKGRDHLAHTQPL